MFETAELGQKASREEYEKAVPGLRSGLLEAQLELRAGKVPVIVVVSGADGAGKGETVKRLHEWLDPRGLETHVFGPLSDEESDRPPFWRFWRTLPARGRIGIFFGSWYTDPIVGRVYGRTKKSQLDDALARVRTFEEMLVRDGALIVKFWLHLSKKAQRRRLEELESRARTRWRVTPLDWKHFKLYDEFRKVSERALQKTDTALAPWHVVEAADDRFRELTVGRTLLEAMRHRLDEARTGAAAVARPPAVARAAPEGAAAAPPSAPSVLDKVDLSLTLSREEYEKRLARAQARLNELSREAWRKKVSTVVLFEGWDAAGKGGAIRRLTEAMDARQYQVIPVAAPTDEERAHHYLWRFWRHIPRAGRVTIFDRTWYGRVLVERVEGFAREEEWGRAYQEIADFEEQLHGHGVALAKFWLHISPEEQLRRFQDREATDYKRHKITAEDWRNREKWGAYVRAIDDMVSRSTPRAPWTLVSGNDKLVARVQIVETVCERLEKAL